jgi:hypothetical protein
MSEASGNTSSTCRTSGNCIAARRSLPRLAGVLLEPASPGFAEASWSAEVSRASWLAEVSPGRGRERSWMRVRVPRRRLSSWATGSSRAVVATASTSRCPGAGVTVATSPSMASRRRNLSQAKNGRSLRRSMTSVQSASGSVGTGVCRVGGAGGGGWVAEASPPWVVAVVGGVSAWSSRAFFFGPRPGA